MKTMYLSLILLLFAALSFAQNVPAYVPANGLVGWWPFNGNANDESGNGNNGTVNGATLTSDRFGNAGKAYSFDSTSTQSINCGPNVGNFTSNFCISLWFNKIGTPGYLISKRSDPNCGSNWWVLSWDDFEVCQVSPNYSFIPHNQNINNSWYQLTVNKTSTNVDLYLNGNLENSISSITNFNLTNNDDLLIGLASFVSTASHNGKIDDIGIWNRALDSTEIAALYTSSTNTSTVLNNSGNDLKIYPNPTNDHITIDAGNLNVMNGYSIRITNSLGQQMFQSAITQQQFYIDLSTWTGNGIYFVNIIDPAGNIIDVKKIILQ